MTNFDAVKAEIAPYTADRNTIEKSLIDNGINAGDNYSVANKSKIAMACIGILTSFLALASESEGGFSQSYNKDGLTAKIRSISQANGIETYGTMTTISDGSRLW